MTSLYEMYYKELYKDRLAQAAAARSIKMALEQNQTTGKKSSRTINDVLQKYRLKFVGVYHDLYQKSKNLTVRRSL